MIYLYFLNMKRNLQISVLLLACVMMLAHSMIPHHHHGTEVCIYNLQGELIGEEHHTHHHDLDYSDEHKDGHCGDTHDGHCCIDDNYLKADECKYSQMICSLGNYSFDFLGQPLLPNTENETYEIPGLLTTSSSFLISYKALYVYAEGGLRAPPCIC